MAVTRRGDTIYLNDGYSDTAFDVEIASNIYNPEKYRVKARSESDALEMILDYRLSKGSSYPFAPEEEFNRVFGDDSWMDQCTYVDRGYWIATTAFLIRPVPDARGRSRSTRGRAVSAIPDGYSEEYPGGPLADDSGYRLVRCNNCMAMFSEQDMDDPNGDVCPRCGFDGALMDVTKGMFKRSAKSGGSKSTRSVKPKGSVKTKGSARKGRR